MSVSTAEPISRFRAATSRQAFFAALALSALVSTILLIMIGSFVRVSGNGLGCPDWPLCHGRAIPPLLVSAWVEFFHRLFGGAVALQIGALIFLAWRGHRHEPWIYRTAVFAGIVLAIQVALGGIHVIYELPRWTGWIHTAVAMLVAGSVAIWVAATQLAVSRIGERAAASLGHSRLPLWVFVGAASSYLLMLTGSLVTRTGAALVCPDFPACGLAKTPDYLKLIVFIQMTHRYTAYTVAVIITAVVWLLLRRTEPDRGLRRFALALAGLLALQITLGIVNVLFALPMWSRVLHLGTAATIWVIMVMLWTTLQRGTVPQRQKSGNSLEASVAQNKTVGSRTKG